MKKKVKIMIPKMVDKTKHDECDDHKIKFHLKYFVKVREKHAILNHQL